MQSTMTCCTPWWAACPTSGACAARTASAPHLLARGFAKWQLPERYEFIEAVPKTSTGKFWKLKLRERYAR